MRPIRHSAIVMLAFVVGCFERPTPTPTPTVPKVTVSVPIEREVTPYEELTGRTDAVSTIDIRARVSGYLWKVHFIDGDIVKENALLYEIDPRPFQAELDRAKGEVEKLAGQNQLLNVQVDRYTKLVAKGAASQQELDTYIGQLAENLGASAAAKAQVAKTQLNLDFTRVTAPITGKISRTLIMPGNLVNADTTQLTTIVSIDPMYAYFNVEEPTLLSIRKMVREGVLKNKNINEVEVRMGLADDVDKKFPYKGKLNFVNNLVDPLTGTITVRGVFANPDQSLIPGLFVRVRIPIGPLHKSVLIADRAVGTDQGQKYVYVVDKDNKAQYRRVQLGPLYDGLREVQEGLAANERIVVTGLQRVRAGSGVEPEMAEMLSFLPSPRADVRPGFSKPAPAPAEKTGAPSNPSSSQKK